MTFGTVTAAYDLTTVDANVASAVTFTVDGSNLTTGTLKFIGSAESNGMFSITGGSGADTIDGGAAADSILVVLATTP